MTNTLPHKMQPSMQQNIKSAKSIMWQCCAEKSEFKYNGRENHFTLNSTVLMKLAPPFISSLERSPIHMQQAFFHSRPVEGITAKAGYSLIRNCGGELGYWRNQKKYVAEEYLQERVTFSPCRAWTLSWIEWMVC